MLLFFPIGRSCTTHFLSKATERDAVDLPRWLSKYNIIFHYVLLTVQEHDCFTNWEQYGLTQRCKILFLHEQTQMKALLLYTSRIKSHNRTLFWSLPSSLPTIQKGRWAPATRWLALEDPAKILLYRLILTSSVLQLYSSREKNDNFYQKPTL